MLRNGSLFQSQGQLCSFCSHQLSNNVTWCLTLLGNRASLLLYNLSQEGHIQVMESNSMIEHFGFSPFTTPNIVLNEGHDNYLMSCITCKVNAKLCIAWSMTRVCKKVSVVIQLSTTADSCFIHSFIHSFRLSQQISTQLNTYGQFWTNSSQGNIFWKNCVCSSSTVPGMCRTLPMCSESVLVAHDGPVL